MTSLLEQIRLIHREAADNLIQADFTSDIEIRSLTREDLHELLPGTRNLRMRKQIFNLLHKPTPFSELQKELRELMQHALASSSRTDRWVLMDHIEFMKTQLNIVQTLLNINIKLLETFSTCQRESEANKGSFSDTTGGHPQGAQGDSITKRSAEDCQEGSLSDTTGGHPQGAQGDSITKRSAEDCQEGSLSDTTGGHPQGAQGDSITKRSAEDCQEARVKYMMVVGGKTFGAHEQLMKQVNDGNCGGKFVEDSQESQITIVFCPITSRIESDINAVMIKPVIPADKPVILVKMFHGIEAKSSLCGKTRTDDRNIVLQVTVFYHETKDGLLKCKLNDSAVSEIQQQLLNLSNHKISKPGTIDWMFGQIPTKFRRSFT
ncbi:uncharacterized protein [Paralichthys olivaceus]|uniref:uncharacterized protein isoform X1 n=1 Tax=Paralichthys olivaceus TaxID=8255 RepID=UPI0037509D3D